MSRSAAGPVCVFDAYGTLFDVHSAVMRHADRLGPVAKPLSAHWREKQLEYTWTRALMERYIDFWQITVDALEHAMASHGIDDATLRRELLDAYRRLDAYGEVAKTLAVLRERGTPIVVFSNATSEMLATALDASGINGLVDSVFSVDVLRTYKPAAAVYAAMTAQLGIDASQVRFHSSNAWDAAGASAFGWQSCWINRCGAPAEYTELPVREHRNLWDAIDPLLASVDDAH